MGVGERKSIRLFGVDLFVINNDDNNNKKDEHEINIGRRKRKKIIKRDQVKSSSEARKKKYYDEKMEMDGSGAAASKSGKKRKMDVALLLPPIPPPEFHRRIVEQVEKEQEPTFLFEKKLEECDVIQDQNRLFIPQSDELMGYLDEEERIKVETKRQNLVVLTTDNNGNQYTMHLTRWHSLSMVLLNRQWFSFVRNNGLQKGDSVQGWGFRGRDNVFQLVLHIIRKPKPPQPDQPGPSNS